jgi:hypothetical protein
MPALSLCVGGSTSCFNRTDALDESAVSDVDATLTRVRVFAGSGGSGRRSRQRRTGAQLRRS